MTIPKNDAAPSRNEDAARLRAHLDKARIGWLDAALDTERLNTVERIRERLDAKRGTPPVMHPVRWGFMEMEIRALLDEVSRD